MKHEGWKFFQGINHERLAKGKKDEKLIFEKIKHLNALPDGNFDTNFTHTKAWNNRVDYQNEDLSVSIEIKRRFKCSLDEFPFKSEDPMRDGHLSTLITAKKMEHLRENNGFLYLQYDDRLFMLDCATLTEDDYYITYPFRVKHWSIDLACFKILD